jgi:predicted nucleic acid-binding protein
MTGSEPDPPPKPVVCNSGPLISLATIDRLELLKSLFDEIIIPVAVYEEVVVQGYGEPGSQEVRDATWIRRVQVKDRLAVNLLRETLDAGESEAIVLAEEVGASYLLLDDALARRKASLIGLHVTGTLGLLLMAKRVNLIASVAPVLQELRQTDFHMSMRVYRQVLAKAGEVET